MPVNVADILRQDDALQSLKWPWTEDWQAIADLMLPGQSDILTIREPGTTRTRYLYDSTALWALDTFVANLSAWITNFSTQWFRLRMRALEDSQEASKWLDEVGQVQYQHMISNEAPIPTAMNEAEKQYAAFGTGGLFIDEIPVGIRPQLGFRGYQANAFMISHYGIAENASGRVDTFYRHFELTPHQMQDYPEWTLHPSTQDALKSNEGAVNKWTPVKILHAVYPRRGADPARNDAQNMPWASVYIDRDKHHLLHEGGYPWFPGMFFRWEKLVAYSPFGYGCGHRTLPESKTLQLIDRDMLRALPLNVLPPTWLIGEGRETANRVSLLPGAMNTLAKGSTVETYGANQRFDVAQLQIEERRQRILRAFFIDQLMFLPPIEQRTDRTLGELQMRARQMLRIMGPQLMRLLPELLNPFIDITFSLLLRAGELPEPPDVILEAAMRDEGQIDVEYLGNLAQAQRSDEADAILEGAEFVTRIAQETQDPVALQNIATDDMIAKYLEARGFPPSLVTDRRVMQEAREAAARQQQALQEQTATMADAQAARDAAPMVRELREVANA